MATKKVELENTCYLVLEPTRSRYGNKEVDGFRVANVLQKPPKKGGAHVIGLTLKVPKDVFEPAEIHATVKVEKSDVQVTAKTKKMPKRKDATWGT